MAAALTHPGWPRGACTCHRRPRRHPDSTPRSQSGQRLPPTRTPSTLPGGPHEATAVPSRQERLLTVRLGRNDRRLACSQLQEETHPKMPSTLPKLLLLLPTHGRGPRRPHGRGRHQAERGRRRHQAPWRSLGDRGPRAPAAAGFAHGPAVPRTRSCYARPTGHIAGRRWQRGCEPCRGRDAEQRERPPSPNYFPKPPSLFPAPALPPP